METLMADISKVCTERFSSYCHQVFLKLIPDKSIACISQNKPNYARHAESKYSNWRSHQHAGPSARYNQKTLAKSIRIHDACCSRVLQCASIISSNTHPTGNLSIPHLSNEVCAKLPIKRIEPQEARGFASGSHKYRRKIAAPKIKPQRPLFPFDVFQSHVPPIQLIYLAPLPSNPRIYEMDHLWKFPQHPSK